MSLSLSDLTLREFELFILASRTGSLREAARQSGLLPAHVSKIMQRLEEKLGQSLFRRSASGILLTPEGLTLLEPAMRICEISQDMSLDPRRAASREKLWTVGSISFLATYLLAPQIAKWRDVLRQSRFRLIEFTHNDLVPHGLKGAFELAVHIEELEWTHLWQTASLGHLRWKLYARRDHPLPARARAVDVAAYSFVVPTDWGVHGYLLGEDFCPLPVRNRLRGDEAATAETALELCRSSEQLTFIPEILARGWSGLGELKEIVVEGWPLVEKEIFLSFRSDVVPKRLVDLARKTLTARIGNGPREGA